MSNLEDPSNSSSLPLYGKTITTNELKKNVNFLESSETLLYSQNTGGNIENALEIQKALKKGQGEDKMGTTDLIEINSKNMDESNAKPRKRFEILMSRNQQLQSCSNLDNNASGSNLVQQINDIDEINKKTKYVPDTQTSKPKVNNIKSEDKFLEKSRFEEIEDKLEEMFAGIDDEKLIKTTPDDKTIPKPTDLNSTNSNECLIDNGLKFDASILNKSLLPTKAAKKSTTSAYAENLKQSNLSFRDHKNTSNPKNMYYLKTMPPRRRFTIGIKKELLKHSIKSKDEVIGKKSVGVGNIVEEDKSALPMNLSTIRDVKKIKKNVLTNKIKTNNQRKRSVYKKELSYIRSSNCINKKIIRKSKPPIKAKQGQQKKKQQQMQRALFENEVEEKHLQTKDIENKNRSPFILIKNNGSIAVINTVTLDDYNEKSARPKKASNYVYERKTVKGCHSSTLSNRYDADTADSSWKCVFCKIGPHKKGLGDLFGPYVISSNCDEYRSIKDTLEHFHKFRRNDAQYLNNSNKSVRFFSESSDSHIRNISECNYEDLVSMCALGMSQVAADCYEIWVHEECAIWAPNIYLVGSRLYGLEEATWNSIRYVCAHCLKEGALLCCLQRDCKTTSHVPCAREYNWLLNESKFWVYCNKHAPR